MRMRPGLVRRPNGQDRPLPSLRDDGRGESARLAMFAAESTTRRSAGPSRRRTEVASSGRSVDFLATCQNRFGFTRRKPLSRLPLGALAQQLLYAYDKHDGAGYDRCLNTGISGRVAFWEPPS